MEEEKEKEKEGRATKLADGIAQSYESVNGIMNKAVSESIRGAGKIIDETLRGTKEGFDEGRGPLAKVGKATIGTGKGLVKGTKKAIEQVIDTVDDTVNETIDGVTKSTDAITPDFVKKTKENKQRE